MGLDQTLSMPDVSFYIILFRLISTLEYFRFRIRTYCVIFNRWHVTCRLDRPFISSSRDHTIILIRISRMHYVVVLDAWPIRYVDSFIRPRTGITGKKAKCLDKIDHIWLFRSYIAQPASSWIDDYFDWLRPEGNPPCCRLYNNTKKFCPARGKLLVFYFLL